uniref:Uncharacterized protein n=1 Tax=Rhizophora mucronata TaxID=61149 RepID=A0A2P2P0V8_RHIMU
MIFHFTLFLTKNRDLGLALPPAPQPHPQFSCQEWRVYKHSNPANRTLFRDVVCVLLLQA